MTSDLSDLGEELRRLAADRTSGSTAWPEVEVAVRRSRRRRRAGTAVVAVLALAGAIVYAGVIAPHRPQVSPSAPEKKVALAQLKAAGYGGPVGGSLAADDAFLIGVKHRVAKLAPGLDPDGSRATGLGLDDVLVPWVGDLDGGRYAVAFYPGAPAVDAAGSYTQPTFAEVVLSGPAGSPATRMTVDVDTTWGDVDPTKITSEQVLWVHPVRPSPVAALVVVTGPQVRGVGVATGRRFSVTGNTGRVATQRRPLHREGGSVWVGRLSADELYMADVAVDGSGSSGGNSPDDESPAPARAREFAPAGTDLAMLDCATDGTRGGGATVREVPVLAVSTPTKAAYRMAATVLRSPDGPYLVSFCLGSPGMGLPGRPPRGAEPAAPPSPSVVPSTSQGTVFAGPSDGDPDRLMVAVEANEYSADAGYLVLAPAGAVTVRIGGQTTPLKGRLAWVPKTDRNPIFMARAAVEALDAGGHVLASVVSSRSTELS